MESTIHCQHLSCRWIQCFQFFLCTSYLPHTWSALTLRRCLNIAITLFFPFNVDFNISFSLLFYPLANSLFFSFSFITSVSVAPKYLNPFHLFLFSTWSLVMSLTKILETYIRSFPSSFNRKYVHMVACTVVDRLCRTRVFCVQRLSGP